MQRKFCIILADILNASELVLNTIKFKLMTAAVYIYSLASLASWQYYLCVLSESSLYQRASQAWSAAVCTKTLSASI